MMISQDDIVLFLKRDCTSVFNFQCCTLILVKNEQSKTFCCAALEISAVSSGKKAGSICFDVDPAP